MCLLNVAAHRPWGSARCASALGLGALCLALIGAVQLAGAASIKAKAWLAPVLIERAWQRSQSVGAVGVKPWTWADTYPVARLRVPSADQNLLVLAGDSGNALAFGPGYTLTSAPLGGAGAVVIGGHRDTHFAFLQHVKPGSEVILETVDGLQNHYRIKTRRVVDAETDGLALATRGASLWLVTCYPFDAILPGGSLRYVVEAVPVKPGLIS